MEGSMLNPSLACEARHDAGWQGLYARLDGEDQAMPMMT